MYKESDFGGMEQKQKVFPILDTIGGTNFWKALLLLTKMLRPLTIDICISERRKATLSDEAWNFGRQ